jgi:hypothetical protein
VRREQSLANRARHRIAARVRFGIKPKVDGGAARGERWALGRVFPGSRGIAKLQDVKAYKFTDYFENEVLRKRPYLKKEWCIQVLENPIRSEPQEKNRFRLGSHHVHETGRPHQVTGLLSRGTDPERPANSTLDLTAGSRPLAAAGQRDR